MNRRIQLLSISLLILLIAASITAYGISTIHADTNIIRVACVGDSITQGSGYTEKLQEMLGPKYVVENFGVDGSAISRDSILPYVNQDEFIRALQFGPHIVVVMLGTNDANPELNLGDDDQFEEDFTTLVDSFTALDGDHKIFLAKSPPILADSKPYDNSYLLKIVFPQIDKLAERPDVDSIDIYHTIGENPDLFYDGVHPNNNGATIIAYTIFETIT